MRKTRLAVEFGRLASARFSRWCGFVSLAELNDPGKIEAHIAAAFQLTFGKNPLAIVAAHLNERDQPGRPPLLILDNLEHLLSQTAAGEPGLGAVVSAVESLLDQVPGLQILCTSRRRLGIRGERLVSIPPLPAPPPRPFGAPEDRATLTAFPSVKLYLDRARAIRPDFDVTETNAAAIAALCRQLEGSPLALELAAAWVRVLPPRKMWERLIQGHDLAAGSYADLPPRHRTLTAVLEWSLRLLPPAEQRLFAALSVFRGGWTLEAAEAVCGEGADTLDLLARLLEASLVVTAEDAGGQARFRFLETVRLFSGANLQFQEDDARPGDLSNRHAAYFLHFAQEAARHLQTAAASEWLAALEADHENLRAALEWQIAADLADPDRDEGVRMAIALTRFWRVRGHWTEARGYLERLTAQRQGLPPTQESASLLSSLAAMLLALGELDTAREHFQECLVQFTTLESREGTANMQHNLGLLALRQGALEEAQEHYERALALQQELGDRLAIADELHHLGLLAHERADLQAARRLYEQSLAIRRPLQDLRGIGNSLQCLANIARAENDPAGARRLYEEDLALRQSLQDRQGIGIACMNLSSLARHAGDWEEAWQLCRQSLTIQHELHDLLGMLYSVQMLASMCVASDRTSDALRLYHAFAELQAKTGAALSPAEQQEIQRDRERLREMSAAADPPGGERIRPTHTWEMVVADFLLPASE